MREIVSIHLGQAGIQSGCQVWELLRREHGIGEFGLKDQSVEQKDEVRNDRDVMFSENSFGYTPRALLFDLEPTVIDETLKIQERFFNPSYIFSGKEDAANIFSRGYYSLGKEMIEEFSEKLRKQVERCEHLQGIQMFRGLGGGTGSGFGSLIFDTLEDYRKNMILDYSIIPSPQFANSVVEPYNSILAFSHQLECYSSVSMMVDNEGLYNVFKNKCDSVGYLNLNRLIACQVSNLTSSLRFNGSLNTDLNELRTNLIPYPRIKFLTQSLAPLYSEKEIHHETLSTFQITEQLFKKESQLASIDLKSGKLMACNIQYRGDFSPYEINDSIKTIKQKKSKQLGIQFVDWVPTGFKIGINDRSLYEVVNSQKILNDFGIATRNAGMLTNTTAVHQVFSRLTSKFDLLYSKRAFVHWFIGEGLEEGELTEARENIAALEKDYQEIDANIENNDLH